MENLYFEELKIRRGSDYFVTYRPPSAPFDFASLALTFLSPTPRDVAALALERELRVWLARYPIPIMATAFDNTDSVMQISENFLGSNLVGWIEPATSEVIVSWKIEDLSAFTKLHPLPANLRSIYSDVPFQTEGQRKINITKNVTKIRRNVRATKAVVFFWFIVVPVGVALFEFFGPGWLGTIILLYAFWQAIQEWRKLSGKKKLAPSEIEANEKKSRAEHYYYHCERNPKAFLRLKLENFEEDARKQTLAEAAQIPAELSQS